MWITELPTHNVWFEWKPWIPAPMGALFSPLNCQGWFWVSLCMGVKKGQIILMRATPHSKDRVCNSAAYRTFAFCAHLLILLRQKGLCCKWQSHLGKCLIQGERSAPKEMTATNFKIVAAFTNQQWVPVPVLTLRLSTVMHHHSVLWKSQDSFAKKMPRSHSPPHPGKYLPSWPTPLTPSKLHSKREQNWRGKEPLAWQIFYFYLHLKSKKEFFIYQRWFLHSSGNCFSRIYFSGLTVQNFTSSFSNLPFNLFKPSCLKNMSGIHLRLPCMESDLKGNAQLLLLALM